MYILPDNDPLIRPTTGHELTTGNMARLAKSSAQALAKYEAMDAQVRVLNDRVAELRVSLDAMQERRDHEAAAKAASDAFRAAQ
jgi:hypothetical protein